MKLASNIAATTLAFALSLACVAGCATSTEPTTEDDTAGEKRTSETPPPVEEGKLEPMTTCPAPAMCALALSKCPNPKLGGSYCYLAQQCVSCRL